MKLMSAPRPAEAGRPPRGSRKVAEPHFLERCTPLLLLALAAAASAAPPNAPANAPANAPPLDCMIQPSQTVQIGTAAPGVVERVAVERGERVARGQAVVQLQASVERAALAVARERAAMQGETHVAVGSQELAQRELARATELYEQNFVSRNFLDKQNAEVKVAGGRHEQAQEKRSLSRREVELAGAQLAQRTIRSPINGVVVESFVSAGEFVDQKPMLRIAEIDPLRVDVLVPAAAFGQVQVGMKGSVAPELFAGTTHQATVKTVDRVIDAASNTFRVRLELPNPNFALPAGLRCKVDMGLNLPAPPPRNATSAVPPLPVAVPQASTSSTASVSTAAPRR